MPSYTLEELEGNPKKVITAIIEALKGEDVVIVVDGVPVCRLEPIEHPRQG